MIEVEAIVSFVAEPNEAPSDAAGDARIRIKAQPDADSYSCKFMLDRMLLPGFSWCFDDPERAAVSPLAAALFELGWVKQVIVDGSTLRVTVDDDCTSSWRTLGPTVASIVRAHVDSGRPTLPDEIIAAIPTEAELRAALEVVIADEINPGVAAHAGVVSLESVRGNTVTLIMGGGCQGCAAASMTLSSGITEAFRRAAPHIGAIYDATDHSAGRNPYFS